MQFNLFPGENMCQGTFNFSICLQFKILFNYDLLDEEISKHSKWKN